MLVRIRATRREALSTHHLRALGGERTVQIGLPFNGHVVEDDRGLVHPIVGSPVGQRLGGECGPEP